jgi:hypothetical protein
MNLKVNIMLWKEKLPGVMISERPKSVAFNGESSIVDLKRKFCKQEEISSSG